MERSPDVHKLPEIVIKMNYLLLIAYESVKKKILAMPVRIFHWTALCPDLCKKKKEL